jgi:hypothetical protein
MTDTQAHRIYDKLCPRQKKVKLPFGYNVIQVYVYAVTINQSVFQNDMSQIQYSFWGNI